MALIHGFSRLQSRPCEGSRATREGENKNEKANNWIKGTECAENEKQMIEWDIKIDW